LTRAAAKRHLPGRALIWLGLVSISYDVLAGAYDELYGDEQAAKYKVILERLSNLEVVLDAGCGTGLLAAALGDCYYVGLDKSRGMLAVAKRLTRLAAADLVRGDAEAMPFRSGAFSHVVSVTVIHEAPGLLGEAFRVVKRGGAVAVTLLRKEERLSSLLAAYGPAEVVDKPGLKDLVYIFRT